MELRATTDHAEWVRLVLNEYERPLLQYCVKIVGNAETARDVVQDVFLRLIRQDRAAVDDHVAEWLFTVCRNRAFDVLKKERRMTEFTEPHERRLSCPAQGNPSGTQEEERRDEVLQLLDALPPRQQEVIRLKFLGGLSYKEISRVTNLTATNVGFLIHTGMKSLREKLHHQRQDAVTPDLDVAR